MFWVELLEDGKLSWFDGAAKRRADFRHVARSMAKYAYRSQADC